MGLMGFAAHAAKKAPLGLFLNAASNPHQPCQKAPQERGACLVRLMGFEPISFRRQILSLLCMPFHHSRALVVLYRHRVEFVKIQRLSRAPMSPPAARNRTGCIFFSFGRSMRTTMAP